MSEHEARITRLERRLAREKAARKEAERLLEHKSLELWAVNQSLERRVDERTAELLLATEAAERARAEAEEASRASQMFLANMSHELRTPMNGILGSCSLVLAEEEVQWRTREVREVVQRSAEALLVIINDILDLSKLASGKLSLAPEPTPLGALAQESLTFVEHAYDRPEVVVRCVDERSEDPLLMLDGGRVRQILLNLLSNAMKFTARGEVRVVLRSRGARVQIRVEDSGAGIPPDQLEIIFQEFHQVDGSLTRKVGGTGLGLAICKRLSHLMGGSIRAESEVGVGSTFVVELPAERAEEALPAVEAEAPVAGLAAGLRVLLVEDNPVNVLVISQMLEHLECEVDHAADGKEAVAAFDPARHDLVLMDCQMPVMNGFEASMRLRALHGLDFPIIALTGNAFDSDREAALVAGMDAHATKPIDLARLEAVLARWDRRSGGAPAGSAVGSSAVGSSAVGTGARAAGGPPDSPREPPAD